MQYLKKADGLQSFPFSISEKNALFSSSLKRKYKKVYKRIMGFSFPYSRVSAITEGLEEKTRIRRAAKSLSGD